MTSPLSRRRLLHGSAALAAGAALAPSTAAEPVARKGRLKQSLVYWCYSKHFELDRLCEVARELGCKSVELVDPKFWPTLKKHGLVCAIASSHGFEKGMNNPAYHEMCLGKLRQAIDACAEFGFPSVITFTGFRENIPDEVGLKNCVTGFKKVLGYAERKKVTLCLEMLNSRVNEEMKGHPGYQGDHLDYCMEIVKAVGSPRLKILFDIYHVQIMDGDVIRRLRQYSEYLGHIHTAGNPGRGELDDRQEINYRAIMLALADLNYDGYIGQEFIPTRDPLAGLREAVTVCDV
jgi:hydroxypyruvate isomerase